MTIVLARKSDFSLNISQDTLLERATGAYLGLAVGDALGASVEFMTPREIQHHYGTHRDIIGGGWLNLRQGDVTDDTEMSFALGEAILKDGSVKAETCAEAFSEWLRGKPVDVGNTVRRGIISYRQTGRVHMEPSLQSAGNGACMRCLPVALSMAGDSASNIAKANQAQAHVTHNNQLSDDACLAVIAMVIDAMCSRSYMQMRVCADDLVRSHGEFDFSGAQEQNPSGYIVHTMRAVLQGFFSTNSFEKCLVDVVNRGGDADTTGAIAGMIAGAFYGPYDIPIRWLKALSSKVRARAEAQAQDLIKLSVLWQTAR